MEILQGDCVKLNVCCGKRIMDGWVNIDVVPTEGATPDILADARKIPLEDACADEIMCIHGIEHFYQWEAHELAKECMRLLKPGGLLAIECPDIIKCCENLLRGYAMPNKDPYQMSYWGLYGDPRTENPYMGHKWGYTPKTLRHFLKLHGFVDLVDEVTQFHPAGRVRRDLRMTARKPAHRPV